MPIVIMLSVTIFIVMLSEVMLIANMLSVAFFAMLSIVVLTHIFYGGAECHNAVCHYAECRIFNFMLSLIFLLGCWVSLC
jgi:hypothetical protein